MTLIYLTFNQKARISSKELVWLGFWGRSIKGQMRKGFLFLSGLEGKGQPFCKGNDYKWPLQLRHPLLQQPPLGQLVFPLTSQSIAAKNTFVLALGLCCLSLSLLLSLYKIRFSCPYIWSFVFILLFPSWRLLHWYAWKEFFVSCQMTTTNEFCCLFLL